MDVSVCIPTFRRPARLDLLLHDLEQQAHPPIEVIVVDNDAAASARAVVDAHRSTSPYALRYAVEPRQNISHARNCSLRLASGAWLAFVDDDERVPRSWLARLAAAASRFRADAVLGPVLPVLPPAAPSWIQRGRFYDWVRMPSGSTIAPNRLRLGNALVRADLLQGLHGPFDPALGVTGGEDGDLLARLAMRGARFVWCDEAPVHEPIEPARLSLRWLLRRALRGGQDFARHTLNGRYGEATRTVRAMLAVRATAQLGASLVLALLCLPAGRHRSALWLTRASANLGKLTFFWGWHYREYA
ncbi:MAG TPA: glycosyltransferase family 2 protein [Nevskiaceae bacterium]|nr:glycosyltransferase family 2 protein [Nevskiaceae bacterium]